MVSRKNWSQEICLSDRKILIRMGYRRNTEEIISSWGRDLFCADMMLNHISFFVSNTINK